MRELYELVTQYWAPKIRKSKSDLEKAPSEKEDEASEEPVTQEGEEEEELEDDEEVEAPNDEEVKAPAAEERKDESGEVSYRELLENLGLPGYPSTPLTQCLLMCGQALCPSQWTPSQHRQQQKPAWRSSFS